MLLACFHRSAAAKFSHEARPPSRVFFRQLCAANRSIEAGWSSKAALENCHRHLVKMTAMAHLCQMCQAGSPFRISYAGSQQNSVLHGRVSCSARTSASTHHGLGTRCRFHAFADVLSVIKMAEQKTIGLLKQLACDFNVPGSSS